MPPGSKTHNNHTAPTPNLSLSEVKTTYWAVQEEKGEIRRRRQVNSLRQDRAWMAKTERELMDLERRSALLEAYAKKKGWWSQLQAARPTSTVHSPSSGSSWKAPRRTSVSRVANVSYGGGSSYSSGTKSWQEKERDAKYKPKTYKEKPTAGRQWESELLHTRAMGALMSEYSNHDAENFRDSHHKSGGRRTATKLGWAAAALGFEAMGIGLSRRIMAGDVPFDFLPKSRKDWDDDDWDLRADDEDE